MGRRSNQAYRFLGVDAYWALCMACNVYLALFKGYTIRQLKSLDSVYLILCYGAAFAPAYLYFWIYSSSRGQIYGPAIVSKLCKSPQVILMWTQIWCWIVIEYDFLRISTLYGIVW